MKGRGLRNQLLREGIAGKELAGQNGSGFVVHLLREDVRPPQITTVVKQPGQDTVTVNTVQTRLHPTTTWRPYAGSLIEPEGHDTIRATLAGHADQHPIARIALQHLAETPPHGMALDIQPPKSPDLSS